LQPQLKEILKINRTLVLNKASYWGKKKEVADLFNRETENRPREHAVLHINKVGLQTGKICSLGNGHLCTSMQNSTEEITGSQRSRPVGNT